MSTYFGTFTSGIYLGSPSATLAVGGYITNTSGRLYGDTVFGSSAAAWNFTNLGSIRATGPVSIGIELTFNGTVINAAAAKIAGIADGVQIGGYHGGNFGTVVNSGTISGTGVGGSGVALFTGIAVVSNSAGGLLTGAANGVVVGSNAAGVSNSGTISGTGTAGNGVNLSGIGGYVINNLGSKILGVRTGVEIAANFVTVTNSGTISASGASGTGVAVASGAGKITNLAGGSILGAQNGIAVSSTVSTVINSGTVSGFGAGGIGVYLPGYGGYVTNNAGGAILGTLYGVGINSLAGIVNNSGTISGTGAGAAGVHLFTGGGVVRNNVGGRILGAFNGVEIASAGGSVSNSGTVAGTGANSVGVHLETAGGFFTNNSGGAVVGVLSGVEIDSTVGTVSNLGSISGTGTHGAGVYVYGLGGYVTNRPGGSITGVRYGVDIVSVYGSVANSGTITGTGSDGIGVTLSLGSVINNATGLITGKSVGISVRLGVVTNFGTVTTGANGTGIYVTAGQVTNYGTIIAPSANAVIVRYGQFVNRGLVQGLSSGIVLSTGSNTTGGGRVTVSGTVSGATGLSVTSTVNTSHTVTVGGTVIGTSGTAVSLSPLGGDRLIVTPGAAFQGTVNGGGGASVLEVTAASSGTSGASGTGAAAASSGAAGFAAAASAYAYVPLGNVTNFSALQIDASAALDPSGVLSFETLVNQGRINIASGDSLAFGTVASAANAGVINLRPGGLIHFRGAVGNQTLLFNPAGGTAVIDHPEQFAASITHFEAVDAIDLALGRATFQGYSGGVLSLSYAGMAVALSVATQYTAPQFTLADDGHGGTQITVAAATPLGPHQSPVVLSSFGWAQGWGSPNNPRMTADVDGHGAVDYLGFGFQSVFVAYGGTFSDGQGHLGHGFTAASGVVNDFGTNEGYAANVQRGAAQTGVGPGASFYGQGFAGVYWYAATGATAQLDAAGHTYNALTYQTSPNLYGNFGSQQGWTPDNGFQILEASASDNFASILGFGNDGIVVGPQAFAPGATAANSFLLPLAAGNNSGWRQSVDIRTFTDANGKVIDLNGDGIADFVGMGPQGLVFALGNHAGPGGGFGLGALQTAHVGAGGTADLGEAQGWNNAATLRYIVKDPLTGFDDILAFGAPGVFVTMGQDPATHGGEPFGQLYLAMADFGSNQGWSVDQTPRIVGDVNGDGIPDIVGFGFNSTFAAIGSRDAAGNLHFALDPSQTIGDFGIAEGWSGSNPQTVRALADVAGSGHADLILSGAFNTQVWQYG